MYSLLGLVLALAAFLAVNALVSLAIAALAERGIRSTATHDPRRRKWQLLAWRLLPSLAAAAVVLGLVAPSYLLFEPRQSEAPGATLLLLALGALAVVAYALRRGWASWRATATIVRNWMAEAEQLPGRDGIAVYGIRDSFPIVSLVGFVHPRVLVARQVLAALTPAELAAVVAHETGHWVSGDNITRLAFRFCPDLLSFFPASRRLEDEWVRASELAADAVAAPNEASAVELGSALVKVARLVAQARPSACLTSALHDGRDVSDRVRRLVAGKGSVHAPRPRSRTRAWGALAAVLIAGAAALPVVHGLVELAVRILP
jgi:Zn-dependent protease with chaperone function